MARSVSQVVRQGLRQYRAVGGSSNSTRILARLEPMPNPVPLGGASVVRQRARAKLLRQLRTIERISRINNLGINKYRLSLAGLNLIIRQRGDDSIPGFYQVLANVIGYAQSYYNAYYAIYSIEFKFKQIVRNIPYVRVVGRAVRFRSPL